MWKIERNGELLLLSPLVVAVVVERVSCCAPPAALALLLPGLARLAGAPGLAAKQSKASELLGQVESVGRSWARNQLAAHPSWLARPLPVPGELAAGCSEPPPPPLPPPGELPAGLRQPVARSSAGAFAASSARLGLRVRHSAHLQLVGACVC